MPTARDGERTRLALGQLGLDCAVCADLTELCRELDEGAGAALLTEEALVDDRSAQFTETLRRQPTWSDFPLVILSRSRPRSGQAARPEALRESMNVFLVERPVRLRSLQSAVRTALRSRRHQYEVRSHLAERERQARALRDNEERLQFALAAGRLGAWDLDLVDERLECSGLFKEIFGRSAEQPFSYEELFAAIHPEDVARVRAAMRRAIDEHASYDIEYRILWPDRAIHWLLMRGMAVYAPDGSPVRMRGVSLDITSRRQIEEALRDSDRKKDDFLALLAHELRNPLAPIRNALQLLHLAPDDAMRERSQQIMERQLGHMVRLIDDLLDVSRINRNKMELRIARITLADVVNSAVETAKPSIDAARHSLSVDLPAQPVFLDADMTRLAQVFANLLTNSAKYTEHGGHILLSVRPEGARVTVTVEDTGIGIPAASLPTIFDMFSQVDRSIERTTGGLGIGLALVKGLVEMHGGTVTAASEGPGRGSQFTVRLPIAADQGQLGAQTLVGEASSSMGPRRRFLVVDDSQDAADSMAAMLQVLGHEVAIAHDGVEAVSQAEKFRPQVILMDVGMPRLNGLDATRQIRQRKAGAEATIIALTGWGQEADRVRSQQAGCDGHLVKPVTLHDLSRLLASLTARRKA